MSRFDHFVGGATEHSPVQYRTTYHSADGAQLYPDPDFDALQHRDHPTATSVLNDVKASLGSTMYWVDPDTLEWHPRAVEHVEALRGSPKQGFVPHETFRK